MDSIVKIVYEMRASVDDGVTLPGQVQIDSWADHLEALTKEPVARLAVNQKYPNDVIKHAIYEVVILDRSRCYDGMELFAAPPAPAVPEPKEQT